MRSFASILSLDSPYFGGGFAYIWKDSAASKKAWLKRARHKKYGVNLEEYARRNTTDLNPTEESIMAKLSPGDRAEVERYLEMAEKVKATIHDSTFVDGDGQFNEERLRLHKSIIDSYFTQDKMIAATPLKGEQPTLVVIGGRGGSGKSKFTTQEESLGVFKKPTVTPFDESRFLKLDPDEIKRKLKPPYAGWNAPAVHEEAKVIFDAIDRRARALGLNVIHDTTLRDTTASLQDVKTYSDAGYQIEGHYMFLPRDVAALRSLRRGVKDTEHRLVPAHIILNNKTNERTFELMKRMFFKRWSAWSNLVPEGSQPVLIDSRGVK